MKSSTPTISVSVELQLLSFFLVESAMGKPRPIDSPPPKCPHMLGWTAKDASTHHFKMPLPLELRIRVKARVPVRYHINHTNLYQSSSPSSRILIAKNDMDVKVSGCASLVT